MKKQALIFSAAIATVLATDPAARAGVFDIPHFVQPGKFALGLEPELNLTNGAGLGANVKYTQGISDITNLGAVLGTGGGGRRFRFGGNMSFDFFPDIDNQPGIGIAVQGIYYRIPDNGLLEITAIPYLHKTFFSSGSEFDPFIALPVGYAFSDSQYKGTATFAMGSMFKTSEKIRTVLEVGVAINHSDSYVSGGIIYYH